MKEIGILFKGPMIRAILEDRKIQTRRIPTYMNTLVDGRSVGKKVWESFEFDFTQAHYIPDGTWDAPIGPNFRVDSKTHGTTHFLTPKWEIEDILWVRENHRFVELESGRDCTEYQASMGNMFPIPNDKEIADYIIGKFNKWRPGIHMPRWACRIKLDIEDVRAERIQEITAEDALAEGVQLTALPSGNRLVRFGEKFSPYDYMPDSEDGWTDDVIVRAEFASLWDSINKERGYGWSENPPCWAFGFGRTI